MTDRPLYFWLQLLKQTSASMLLVSFLTVGYTTVAIAQARADAKNPSSFSLKQSVAFAVENNVNSKNAQLDVTSSQHRVKEIIAIGLPQISATANYAYTYNVQKVILENEPGAFFNPTRPQGEIVAFGLQLPNSVNAQFQWQQLLFDGSYLIGIQASKVYIQLAEKNLRASKITIAENVTKAYYSVLVNRERFALFDLNLSRLDSTMREIKALNIQGFAEKLDVDRLEVTRNNLISEREKTRRLVDLSEQLLKFQMGYPQRDPIVLTEKMEDNTKNELLNTDATDYSKRIEYSTLETQKALAELDLRNVNAGYFPKLFGQFSFGANTAASAMSNVYKSNRWFYYDQLAVSLSVPIFDGFSKYHQAQQKKINIRKADNGFQIIKQSIDLQIVSANTSLRNAQETMVIQKRNMELAAEVARVSKVKYTQGVGSNLEVTTAESQLKEAQINYFNAVYDMLIAKVDQQVAAGTLNID